MITLRTIFLSLHVAGGVTGLLVGIYALRPPQTPQFRLWIRRIYAAALGVLGVFLVATVAVDWAGLDVTQRAVYSGLIGLAIFIVARLYLAYRLVRRQPDGWQERYLNHIYFTYISLWEAFLIVGLIDMSAPVWLTGAVAVGVVILGATLLNRYKQRLFAVAHSAVSD